MPIHLRADWVEFIYSMGTLPAPQDSIANIAAEYRYAMREIASDPNEVPPCVDCPDLIIFACKMTGQECREYRTFCEDPPRYHKTYGGKDD